MYLESVLKSFNEIANNLKEINSTINKEITRLKSEIGEM